MREFKGRVVTPGTVIETNMLEEKKNNYIMSIVKILFWFLLLLHHLLFTDFQYSKGIF